MASPDLRARRRDQARHAAFYALAMLIVAAITHLTLVLAAPRRAERDAYAQVTALVGKVPLKTVSGPAPAAASFPYRDPAIATAFCLYDLRNAPVRVSVPVAGADFIAVSFHSRRGIAFYGLTNRSASNNTVALTLMTSQQVAEAEARDTGDEPIEELRVTAPDPEGFVLVQALATTPSAMPSAQADVQRLSCSAARPQ